MDRGVEGAIEGGAPKELDMDPSELPIGPTEPLISLLREPFELDREGVGVPGGVPIEPDPVAVAFGVVPGDAKAPDPLEPNVPVPLPKVPEPERGLEPRRAEFEAEGDILPRPAIRSRMPACLEAEVKDPRLLIGPGMGIFFTSPSCDTEGDPDPTDAAEPPPFRRIESAGVGVVETGISPEADGESGGAAYAPGTGMGVLGVGVVDMGGGKMGTGEVDAGGGKTGASKVETEEAEEEEGTAFPEDDLCIPVEEEEEDPPEVERPPLALAGVGGGAIEGGPPETLPSDALGEMGRLRCPGPAGSANLSPDLGTRGKGFVGGGPAGMVRTGISVGVGATTSALGVAKFDPDPD